MNLKINASYREINPISYSGSQSYCGTLPSSNEIRINNTQYNNKDIRFNQTGSPHLYEKKSRVSFWTIACIILAIELVLIIGIPIFDYVASADSANDISKIIQTQLDVPSTTALADTRMDLIDEGVFTTEEMKLMSSAYNVIALTLKYQVDGNSWLNFNMDYDAFVNKSTRCKGIASAYSRMLAGSSIPNCIAYGSVVVDTGHFDLSNSNGAGHAWNVILGRNGIWYACDLTNAVNSVDNYRIGGMTFENFKNQYESSFLVPQDEWNEYTGLELMWFTNIQEELIKTFEN